MDSLHRSCTDDDAALHRDSCGVRRPCGLFRPCHPPRSRRGARGGTVLAPARAAGVFPECGWRARASLAVEVVPDDGRRHDARGIADVARRHAGARAAARAGNRHLPARHDAPLALHARLGSRPPAPRAQASFHRPQPPEKPRDGRRARQPLPPVRPPLAGNVRSHALPRLCRHLRRLQAPLTEGGRARRAGGVWTLERIR